LGLEERVNTDYDLLNTDRNPIREKSVETALFKRGVTKDVLAQEIKTRAGVVFYGTKLEQPSKHYCISRKNLYLATLPVLGSVINFGGVLRETFGGENDTIPRAGEEREIEDLVRSNTLLVVRGGPLVKKTRDGRTREVRFKEILPSYLETSCENDGVYLVNITFPTPFRLSDCMSKIAVLYHFLFFGKEYLNEELLPQLMILGSEELVGDTVSYVKESLTFSSSTPLDEVVGLSRSVFPEKEFKTTNKILDRISAKTLHRGNLLLKEYQVEIKNGKITRSVSSYRSVINNFLNTL